MRLFLFICGVIFVCRPSLLAQEPELPKPEAIHPDEHRSDLPSTTSPANTPAPAASPLIPPDVLPLPDRAAPIITPTPIAPSLPELDAAFKQTPINSVTENSRQLIEWRRLRNLIANDPQVKTALVTAEAARTDLEKRKLLREYYELYFAKIMAIAPAEMKPYLTARKKEQLARLPQPRVRPTPAVSPNQRP